MAAEDTLVEAGCTVMSGEYIPVGNGQFEVSIKYVMNPTLSNEEFAEITNAAFKKRMAELDDLFNLHVTQTIGEVL